MQFRRRRFTTWLSDAILENRPYDTVVRDLVADQGLWTDHPATNFVSVTIQRGDRAARSRAAGCPGVAGLPGRPARLRPVSRPPVPALEAGRLPGPGRVLRRRLLEPARHSRWGKHVSPAGPQDQASRDGRTASAVPSELLPGAGSLREQLAGWIVNPGNPNLARATVNRVWALLFGRPLVDPVDDLPVSGELPPMLLLLAGDFSSHGYDLHRLIRIIAATEVFRLESTDATPAESDGPNDENWAAFPLTRLATGTGGRGRIPGGVAAHPGPSISLVRSPGHLYRPQQLRPPLRRHRRG